MGVSDIFRFRYVHQTSHILFKIHHCSKKKEVVGIPANAILYPIIVRRKLRFSRFAQLNSTSDTRRLCTETRQNRFVFLKKIYIIHGTEE